jgi:hypothetical protein
MDEILTTYVRDITVHRSRVFVDRTLKVERMLRGFLENAGPDFPLSEEEHLFADVERQLGSERPYLRVLTPPSFVHALACFVDPTFLASQPLLRRRQIDMMSDLGDIFGLAPHRRGDPMCLALGHLRIALDDAERYHRAHPADRRVS